MLGTATRSLVRAYYSPTGFNCTKILTHRRKKMSTEFLQIFYKKYLISAAPALSVCAISAAVFASAAKWDGLSKPASMAASVMLAPPSKAANALNRLTEQKGMTFAVILFCRIVKFSGITHFLYQFWKILTKYCGRKEKDHNILWSKWYAIANAS